MRYPDPPFQTLYAVPVSSLACLTIFFFHFILLNLKILKIEANLWRKFGFADFKCLTRLQKVYNFQQARECPPRRMTTYNQMTNVWSNIHDSQFNGEKSVAE